VPHSSKKKRRAAAQSSSEAKRKSRQNLYIVVGVVAAIVAIAAGVSLYYSYHSTTATSTNAVIYANLKTSQGTMEVELFQGLVPATVNNFVALAESGFYNNLTWHRLQPNFVIQTGDPNTRNGVGNECNSNLPHEWGTGGSTTTVAFEVVPSLHNNAGYLGMASSGAHLGGTSQFYINLKDNSQLDGSYAVFGKIVSPSGLNIANAIANLPPNPSCPNTGLGAPPANPAEAMLISVTILNTTSTT
jgi:peptidyl-prolyl cis-trans isomerase B (cyclophilin B)